MDRLSLVLHAALIICTLLAAWRLWALSKEVERSRQRVEQTKVDLDASSRVQITGRGLPARVYSVEIRAAESATSFPVGLSGKPDSKRVSAAPLVMLNGPASLALADDVAVQAIRYILLDGTVFRVASFGTYEQRYSKKWKVVNSRDAVVWLLPINPENMASFPFPGATSSSTLAVEGNEDGIARVFILGM
nr:hypothetical protein TetV2_00265 [Oceanusvirus sp.]